MGTALDFVPRNARAQFRQFRMKQRGVFLVSTPPHTRESRPEAELADYTDDLAAARGIINALALLAFAAVPFLVFWFVVEFAH